jgi:hypothetical protein
MNSRRRILDPLLQSHHCGVDVRYAGSRDRKSATSRCFSCPARTTKITVPLYRNRKMGAMTLRTQAEIAALKDELLAGQLRANLDYAMSAFAVLFETRRICSFPLPRSVQFLMVMQSISRSFSCLQTASASSFCWKPAKRAR